ncbi:hypothetical protein BC830DRAFT_1167103 [Chytriomyces sp. MP71]|nr:hypothetical protein BC830DRAFT_1167103 [Chytriomyces sp. MP71]
MNLPEPAPPAMTAKQLISSGDIITASAGQSPAVSSLLIPRLFTEDARSESDCSITDECKSSNASHSNLAIKKGTAKDLRRKIIMGSMASLDGNNSSTSGTDSEDSGSDVSCISLSGAAMMRARVSHSISLESSMTKGAPGHWSPALSYHSTSQVGSLTAGGHKKPTLDSLDTNNFSDAHSASGEQSEDESGGNSSTGSREFMSSASSSSFLDGNNRSREFISSSSLDIPRHSGANLVRRLTSDRIRRRLNMGAKGENSPKSECGSHESSDDNVAIGSLNQQEKVKDSLDSFPIWLAGSMGSNFLDNSSSDSLLLTDRISTNDLGSQEIICTDRGGGVTSDLRHQLSVSSDSSSLNDSTESIISGKVVFISSPLAQKKITLSGGLFASQQSEIPAKMTATDIIMKLAKKSSLDNIPRNGAQGVTDNVARSAPPSKTKVGDLFPFPGKKERTTSETPSESTEFGLEDLKKEFLSGPQTNRLALTKLERPMKGILKKTPKPFVERDSSDGLYLTLDPEERITKVKWLQVYSSSRKKAQRIKRMDVI